MAKVRIYELAKKYSISNKDVISVIASLGIEAKSHMSVIDQGYVSKVDKIVKDKLKAGDIDVEKIKAKPVRKPRKKKAKEEVIEKVDDLNLGAEVKDVSIIDDSHKLTEQRIRTNVIRRRVRKFEKEELNVEEIVRKAEDLTPDKLFSKLDNVKSHGEKDMERAVKQETSAAEEHVGTYFDRSKYGVVKEAEPKVVPELKIMPDEALSAEDEKAGKEAKKVKKIKLGEISKPSDPSVSVKVEYAKDKKKGKDEYKTRSLRFIDKEELARKNKKTGLKGPEQAFSKFGRKKKKQKTSDSQKTQITTPKAIKRKIKMADTIIVGELAKRMGIKANDLIKKLFSMGLMVTINQAIDLDTAILIASEYSFEIENVAFEEAGLLEDVVDKAVDLSERPPVVTVMGHVDHGKTKLLDAIRDANVIDTEAGGITQHIGAYNVMVGNKSVTFIDTPGHEAFTSMRARGANITDIVVLVVAADDGVMPQTVEAIRHAKAAGVQIIVAINKMDLPSADANKVKQTLTEYELVCEEWGGDTIFVEVSAKQKEGIDTLLEMILLKAEMLELKANPDKNCVGVVVEAKMEKGRGPVATVLVRQGTLNIGDYIVAGTHSGRVRAMTNHRRETLETAPPSTPVEVIGFSSVPIAGEVVNTSKDEKIIKQISDYRTQKAREAELASTGKITLEELYTQIKEGEVQDINVIVKADTNGSVEAITDSFAKLSNKEVKINVLHGAVGGILETDVMLAAASNAIIVGFSVRPDAKASEVANKEKVDIKIYNIIYDAIDAMKAAIEGVLSPELIESIIGKVEVRETFTVPKLGTIAGSYVVEGKINRNSSIRILRDNIVIYDGKIKSLRRFKDDAKEVAQGYECGVGVENYNDLKVGDYFEVYEVQEKKRKFESAKKVEEPKSEKEAES
ncbi:MAG: translation initiation factor IF-2 [Pseudomonadota bacterium]